jgi:hypothetical protein
MSDKYTSLFVIDASFVEGEQPTAQKLTNIVSLTKSSLVQLEKAVGMIRDSLVVERTGNATWVPIPAKDSYSVASVNSLKLDSPSHIASIARAIGPMGALNPRYLSQQTWLKGGDGAIGILLKDGVTEQQLPFKPLNVNTILPGDFSGPAAAQIFATRVTSYEASLEVGKYYITPEGKLFTGAPVRATTRLKYSFVIGEGDGYIGSGYNVIPDPSILTFTLTERDNKTIDEEDFGGCRVLVSSVNEEALVVDILLPEVISTPFSKLSRTHGVEDSDPVGKIDGGLPNYRRYSLPDYYPSTGVIEENTMYLYYAETGKVIPEAKFERISEFQIRAYLPARYKTIVRTDDGELFNTVGLSNTKHFFLITNGTQLAPLVGKLRLEMEEHSHNGLDSVRVSHNDLADVNHILPTLPAQLNVYANVTGVIPDRSIIIPSLPSGSQTRWFNRKFSKGSFFEENPHPYYLHRLGYLGGGTDGLYASKETRVLGGSLGNGFAGDLVLMPVTSNGSTDEGGYTWESTNLINYIANNSASHSLWFGLPWEVDADDATTAIAQKQRNGSVRMYFDPWIRVMGFTSGSSNLPEPFSTEGLGVLNTGTIGADVFSNDTFQNAIKGLSIQRGNFFFGYNEDKFLSTTERAKGKSSFNVLASEFNSVVNANGKADQSPEGRWKGKSGNRAGFVAKAIEGASINFSIGGLTGTPGEPVNQASLTSRLILGENYKTAGSFTVEGAFGNQLIGTSPNKAHGAGVLISPGMGSRKLFSWQVDNREDLIDDENVTYYAGWKRYEPLQSNFYTSVAQNLGGVNHIFSTLNEDLIENWLSFKKSVDLTESVKNKNSFPFGKVIIEGGSGIDLLVSRRSYNSVIGNVLDLSEVRFWAREDLKSDIDNDLRDSVAAGANINLMYGYGKSYSRFGTNLAWLGSDFDIKGEKQPNTESLNGGINPWTSLRSEGHQAGFNKDARGSQIRQASFIEAMEGFRSDPNQPFTVSYRLPFRVMQRLTWMSEGYTTKAEYEVTAPGQFGGVVFVTGPETSLGERSFTFIPSAIIGSLPIHKSMVIAEMEAPMTSSHIINPAINVSTFVGQPSLDIGRFEFGLEENGGFTDELGYRVFVDQIIRYYDYQDWGISGYQGPLVPGQSLVDFSVELNYSKLVYGDSESELFGQQFPIRQPMTTGAMDLDSLYRDPSEPDDLAAYISSKHASVINGCFTSSVDDGLIIRAQGSTSGLADVDTTGGIQSWVSTSTYEPYKASLMIGKVNLNEDEDYRNYDSIGYNRWIEYITNIKNSVDAASANDADYWGEGGTYPLGSENGVMAWYIQLEGEPKREDYSVHRFAPYELFLSSTEKEYGYGLDKGLMMAFDGYVNLTFKTRGGSAVPRSGVISQTGVIT